MKRSIKLLLISLMLIIPINVKALELNISSKNAILYNVDSKEILYEKNSEDKVQIASLTKIMTALVSIENIDDLDKQVIMKKEDFKGITEANLVTAGFTVGEIVTYRDLLYGLLLPSGAEAAKSLSRNIAGSEEEFIKLMNNKVKNLGLKNTNFSNVIGLDDEKNYSSVKDLLIIFSKALENENFKAIIKSKEYKTSDGKLTFKSTIQRNAKTFNIDIPYVLGGKTGTTTGAGLCLATIALENDVNYILITTGALYDKKAPHHIEDAKTIYDYFIENYSNQKIVDKNKSFKTIPVKYAKEEKIKLYPAKDIIKYLPNKYDKKDVKYDYEGIEEVSPFTKKKLGTLSIYYKDELLSKESVYFKTNLHFNILKFIKGNILYFITPVLIVVIILKKRAK